MRRYAAVAIVAFALTGCASAGGTAGIFNSGSVWYKHPTTGEVRECGGGFYPGVQIRRYNCGKRLMADGYREVEKCHNVRPGELCVTDDERRASEAREAGLIPAARAWVLWQSANGQWSPVRGFDSRRECETEQERTDKTARCLPDNIDPRTR